MDQFIHILSQSGHRITRTRTTIFQLLLDSPSPLLTAEIASQCTNVDRVSVYRTMELFTELGVVHQIPRGWKHVYELADPFQPHHHHFSCNACGSVISLESPQLEATLQNIANKHGFVATSHTFELRGTCKACRARSN